MSRYNAGIIDITEGDAKKLRNDFGKPFTRIKSGAYNVYYGFDHAVGYFLQGFDLDDPNEVVFELDFDSFFDGLSGLQLGSFLKMYKLNNKHAEWCLLDREI